MVTDALGRMIRTASDSRHVRRARGYRHWVEKHIRDRWPLAHVEWDVRGSDWVYAEVIRGQWAIRCPYCAGAQLAEPSEPFICVDCMNAANAGHAIGVIWPDDNERHAIERLLLRRTTPQQMNFLPRDGETYDSLLAESIEHGDVEVGDDIR